MKKIYILILFSLVFSLPSPTSVYAVNTTGISQASPQFIETTTMPEKGSEQPEIVQSEYILPYPGILPDHPLYTLKKMRDSILELLITDPIRKIEFYVLQSDKEVSAAQFLSIKGKKAYIFDSLRRAIGFKEKALLQAKTVKTQGKEVPSFLIERIASSFLKQSDIQKELEAKADEPDKAIYTSISEKISLLKAAIDGLKK